MHIIAVAVRPKLACNNYIAFRISNRKNMTGDNMLVLLRGETNSSHAHKTGSWYILGVLYKIPDRYPCPFYTGVPLPVGVGRPLLTCPRSSISFP